jgi:hypothetical protein
MTSRAGLLLSLVGTLSCAGHDARPGDPPVVPVDSGIPPMSSGAVPSAADTGDPRTAAASSPVAEGGGGDPRVPIDRAAAPLVPTPDTLRGLYVNRWATLGQRMWELIDLAKSTEVNSLVLDVKDDRGFVLYRSNVALAREIGADTNQPVSERRMRAVLDTMRAHGLYPIARIVVAKDELLASKKPEWAIRRRAAPEEVWLDRNRKPWLDPTHPEIWTYAADLAAEAVQLGFSEVQFDYVRFPDENSAIREGLYTRMEGRVRAQVIRDQLGYLRDLVRPLGVPMTIDVFGLTATDAGDMGIGQKWEMFIDRADVVLPMAYPSHYAPGTYGLGNPNANPYATIAGTLRDVIRRSAGIEGAAKVIPWYQDFTLGSPRYTATEVRAQMQAGYDLGFHDWILWNPRSVYTVGALERR